MDKITIDQLITRLTEAKALIGGDKEVFFWQDTGIPQMEFALVGLMEGDMIDKISLRQENLQLQLVKI